MDFTREMEMEAETDTNFSDKGTSTAIRDCFVRLGLPSPILEIEQQLSELTKEDFLTDPDARQQTCIICAKPFQSSSSSSDTEDLKRKLEAFRMFCLLILNNPLELPDSTNDTEDEISCNFSGRSFQCCEDCCIDLEILEIAYKEMCKKIVEFENSIVQILQTFFSVFLRKLLKPSSPHSRQEVEPILSILLKRWKNHLVCRVIDKNKSRDRSCLNSKGRKGTAVAVIRRRHKQDNQKTNLNSRSKSSDSCNNQSLEGLEPPSSELLEIGIKEEAEHDYLGNDCNEAEQSVDVLMEEAELAEEVETEPDFDFEDHNLESNSSYADNERKKQKRETSRKFPRSGNLQRSSRKFKPPKYTAFSSRLRKKWSKDKSGSGPDYPYKCDKCGRAWKTAVALTAHMQIYKDPELRDKNVAIVGSKLFKKQKIGTYSFFVCEICGQKFAAKFPFQQHMKFHLDTKTFPCPTCGKQQKSEQGLKNHINCFHNQKAPSCRFCGRKITGIALYLRKHELTHHREEYLSKNPFYCPTCLLTFPTQNELKSHVLKHESCKCKICGFVYLHARGLRVHERRHYIAPRTDITKEAEGMGAQTLEGLSVLCLLCPLRFETDELARTHYQQQHGNMTRSRNRTKWQHNKDPKSKGALNDLDQATHVCPTCGREMKTEHQLQKHVAYAHEEVLECRFCGDKVSGISLQLRRHEFTEHKEEYLSETPFYCIICLKTFASQTELDSHVVAHDSCKCKICGYVCQTLGGIKMHVGRHYMSTQMDVTKEGNDEREREPERKEGHTVLCLLCPLRFDDDDHARAHYQDQHKLEIEHLQVEGHQHSLQRVRERSIESRSCALGCPKTTVFRTLDRVRQHYVTEHKEIYLKDKPFWCPTCFRTFETHDEKIQHELDYATVPFHKKLEEAAKTSSGTNEPPERHQCDICGQLFRLPVHLKWHKERNAAAHLPPEARKANTAARSAMRKAAVRSLQSTSKTLEHHREFMRQHARKARPGQRKTRADYGKIDCGYCGQTMSSMGTFRNHLLKEHREEYLAHNKFLCEICKRTYPTQAALEEHYEVAAISHPKCKFCNRMFENHYKCTEHERVHTGEKPIVCEICGMGFAYDSNYRTHKKVHTGERSIWCSLCPEKTMGFFRKRELQKHMEKRHPNECVGVSQVTEAAGSN